MKRRHFFAAPAAVLLHLLAAITSAAEPVQKTIDYLIQTTAESGFTFIRNGTEHTAPEAAAVMKRKLGFVRAQVRTPEDFIRLAASQSHLTGKPYLVKLGDGKTLSGRAWLTGVLAKYRASHPE